MHTKSATKQIMILADSNEPAFKVLQVYLEHAGFGVTTAINGTTAFQTFAQNRPALVILDLDLKGFSILPSDRLIRFLSGRGVSLSLSLFPAF